jgi:hypothetical protein
MQLQNRHWLLTIPHYSFTPFLPRGISYIQGQLERAESGFLHWQIYVVSDKKLRLGGIKSIFGDTCHAEPTRSEAGRKYVWKEDTRVPNTQFELGSLPIRRNSKQDWDTVWEQAKKGLLEEIPAAIRVPHYRTLRAICSDFAQPVGMERTVHLFWGKTGTGKSKRAWDEAGLDAYSKDPRTKFWDGYKG